MIDLFIMKKVDNCLNDDNDLLTRNMDKVKIGIDTDWLC